MPQPPESPAWASTAVGDLLGSGLTSAADDVVAGALAVLALTGLLHDSTSELTHARALTHTASTALFRVGSTSGHDLCAGMAGALAAAA